MIKRGISGIILCFFCCAHFFNFIVFADQSDWWEEESSELINQTIETQSSENEQNTIDYVLISDENENLESWEIDNSDSENIPPDDSVEIVEGIENDTEETILLPEILIEFQNPTYLIDKNLIKDVYICDDSRSECKVNIKITDSYGDDIWSDFWCRVEYSIGETIDNCNPTTVIFPLGLHTISVEIFEKNDISNYLQKSIQIENMANDSEDTEQPVDDGSTQDDDSSIPSASWSLDTTFDIPEIELEVQSGLELISDNIYECTSTQECKVNLDVTKSFSWSFDISDFSCEWDFWSWSFSTPGTDQKCNPWYVVFPQWNNLIWIKVYHKDNYENFQEWNYIFKNTFEDNQDNIENPSEPWNGDDNIDDSSWTGSWLQEPIFPEILLEIQSGLDFLSDNIYYCSNREECKVNVDITESFSWGFNISNFSCEWDFWSWSFSTPGTDQKCNPWYVIFPEWEHDVSLKVIQKENSENFQEKLYIIKNIQEYNDDNQEPNDEWNSQGESGNDQEDIIDPVDSSLPGHSGSIIIVPDINIEIQSWWELSWNTIICDKNDCKLNFTLDHLFNEQDNWKYICEWDFWWATFSTLGTENKCNPGYINYPIWEFILSIKVIDKGDIENFTSQTYNIKNILKKSSWGSSKKNDSKPKKETRDVSLEKEIIIQSGLENNLCNEENCKINLKYPASSYESCIWDFGEYESRETYTHTCNPRNVYFPYWLHEIKLQVFNEKTRSNHDKYLFFTNIYQWSNQDETLDYEIELQWKKSEFRKKMWNEIVCIWVQKCNINLKIHHSSKYTYFWDLWNGEYVEKSNPKAVWYSSWSYKWYVKISENDRELMFKEFSIEVIAPEEKQMHKALLNKLDNFEQKEKSFLTVETQKLFSQSSVKNLSIKNLSTKTEEKFSDMKQSTYKKISQKINNIPYFDNLEIWNTNKRLRLTRNIYKQKKSLKYSWKTFPNASVFIDTWDEFIETFSDENWKYVYTKQDFLESWLYTVDYYVIDSQWNYFSSSSEKVLELSESYTQEFNQKIIQNNQIIQNKKLKSSQKTEIYWSDDKKSYDNDYQDINLAWSVWVVSKNELYLQWFIIFFICISWVIFWRKYNW